MESQNGILSTFVEGYRTIEQILKEMYCMLISTRSVESV